MEIMPEATDALVTLSKGDMRRAPKRAAGLPCVKYGFSFPSESGAC